MPCYAVVQLVPTDQEKLAEYRTHAVEAVKKHFGRPFAGGPGTEVLEDTGAGSTMVLVAEFPTAENARAWIGDPELADIHALRRAGAKSTIMLLPEFAA